MPALPVVEVVAAYEIDRVITPSNQVTFFCLAVDEPVRMARVSAWGQVTADAPAPGHPPAGRRAVECTAIVIVIVVALRTAPGWPLLTTDDSSV